MITIKKSNEIDCMRKAGKILAKTRAELANAIIPNKTSAIELDALAHQLITKAGAIPSFLNFRGYPASVCISINEVVVHGIPSDTVLAEGDIVGIDLGVCYQGWHVDSAWTYGVGTIGSEAQKLLNITKESLYQGIHKALPGSYTGDIASTIQCYVESHGFSVVRDLVGHGIGRELHEEPSVPNFGRPKTGTRLKEGMTLCIEPMINQGGAGIKVLPDRWTIVTKDGKLSAHFEHTILITKDGFEILTEE